MTDTQGVDVRTLPGARRTTASRSTPLVVPTEEEEAATAAANYDAGVTYEVASESVDSQAEPYASPDAAPAESPDVSSDEASKAKPIDYDHIGFTECRNQDQSFEIIGWTKNHYSWCQVTSISLFKYRVIRGVRKQVAALYGNRMLRGESTRQNRTVHIKQTVYGIYTDGDWTAGVGLDSGFQCDGSPTFGQCNLVGGQYTQVRTGSTQDAKFTLTSDVGGSKGRDKKGIMVFKPWTGAYDASGGYSVSGYTQGMRCDSAAYTKPAGKACIFDRVEGTLTFDRKNSKVTEAAKHMYDAQNNPEKTYPKFKGKTIPGTLHRIWYDKDKIAANTKEAIKVCVEEWGKDYAKDGDDCDEYPFKTTKEGAAKGDDRFSSRPVNLHHNRSVGSQLGKWYDSDHILDGDAFHIRIK